MVWPPTKRQVLWAIGMVVALFILALIGVWLWGVLSGYIQPRTPTEKKDLLNVFVLLAAGVVGFLTAMAALWNAHTSRRNLQQQRDLDERRAQDDALQAYYKQMGDLLTEHDLKKTQPDDDVALLGRAQTLTVLRRLDAQRKRDMVLFLYGAGLINNDSRIVDLAGAGLISANLSGAYLHLANLSRANLSGAILATANLRLADLSSANLRGANLRDAILATADLSNTDLRGANLRGANLRGANLRSANLSSAILSDAILAGADLSFANFGDANLSGVNLRLADLSNAIFSGADLSGADLSEAKLGTITVYGTDLRGAVLSGAKLSGATLPNGQKYEEWAKNITLKSIQNLFAKDADNADTP